MTVEEIIQPIVSAMNANGDSFSFVSASEWTQNTLADDIDLPVVFLTRPHKFKPTIVSGGGYRRRYVCNILFLYKDSFENTPEQRAVIFEKASLAQRDFHIRLDNDTNNIKDLIVNDCTEIYHLFDSDISGVMMPFTFEMKENSSVCI